MPWMGYLKIGIPPLLSPASDILNLRSIRFAILRKLTLMSKSVIHVMLVRLWSYFEVSKLWKSWVRASQGWKMDSSHNGWRIVIHTYLAPTCKRRLKKGSLDSIQSNENRAAWQMSTASRSENWRHYTSYPSSRLQITQQTQASGDNSNPRTRGYFSSVNQIFHSL